MRSTEEQTRNVTAYYIMIIGLFMAVLDIQIVASSLSEIQAAVSASMDEISWVQTSYLMAEVVMIPICGWLSEVFSTRILFAVCCGVFTLASGLCAFAWNFESLIVMRAVQGFFGGAMIPTVFSSVYIMFPPKDRSKATILAGLVATIAPTLGPTLGGWISTNFSWHWLFLINIVPGIFVTYGVYRYLDIDRPRIELLKKFDYIGFVTVAVALGMLEVFLKKGHKHDWFESGLVLGLFAVMMVSFLIFVWRELTCEHPIVDLKAFRDVNFTVGCILSFAIGVGLYGCVYLLPVLLSTVRGYSSLQIGKVMFAAGLFQFMSGPIAGFLEKKGMDLRVMLCIGLVLFGVGSITNGFMTADVGFDELFWHQAIRGISIMLCFLPMTTVTLGRLPRHEVKNASGLYSLMRNLGGAIGIAVIDTVLSNGIRRHHGYLSENFSQQHMGQVNLPDMTDWMFNHFVDLEKMDKIQWVMLDRSAKVQALVMSFNDTFKWVGVYLIACCILIIFVKKVKVDDSVDGGMGH